jgi:hypothetical protein
MLEFSWIAAGFYHGGTGLGNELEPLAQKEASRQSRLHIESA